MYILSLFSSQALRLSYRSIYS